MEQVLLFSVEGMPLNIIHWKDAVRLVVLEKAKVLKYADRYLTKTFKQPSVIQMLYAIKAIYKIKAPYKKEYVFIRDGRKCAYCGKKGKLTIDHIIPRSKGGKTKYTNVVAACPECNNKKGDRYLEETGMILKIKPYVPTIFEIIMKRMKRQHLDKFLND